VSPNCEQNVSLEVAQTAGIAPPGRPLVRGKWKV
jgi:hypothetical protein